MKRNTTSGLRFAVRPVMPCHGAYGVDGALSALLLIGLLLVGVRCTGTDVVLWWILLFGGLLAGGVCLCCARPRIGFLTWAVPLTAAAVCLLLSPRGVANGFVAVCNGLLDGIGAARGAIMTKWAPLGAVSTTDATWFWSAAAALLSLPLALCVRNRYWLPPMVLAVGAGTAAVFVGSVDGAGISCLVCGTVGLALNKLSGFAAVSGKAVGVRLTALGGCVALLLAVCLSGMGERSVPLLSGAGEAVADTVDALRFGSGYVLPQGDFSDLRDFTPSDTAQLEVVMSCPDSYYLRGFVGTVYTGSGWDSPEPAALYADADLFYWLHQEGFYGQTQLAALTALLEPETAENRIHIRNLGASPRYVYAPYEVWEAKTLLPADGIGDTALYAGGVFGSRSYTYTATANQVKRYTTLAAGLYEAEDSEAFSTYGNGEAHYNAYVYKTCLELPETVRHVLETLLGGYEIDEAHMDYGRAKQSILDFLTANMTYSERGGAVDGDFVSAFLQQTRSGYSVHFATAAALMLRYYGIPARYVEGYLITPADVEGVLSNTAITLDETHAHAWAEFYQDGVGWVPFEVTPPYLDIMETADGLTGTQPDTVPDDPADAPDMASSPPSTAQGTEDLIRQSSPAWRYGVLAAGAVLLLLVLGLLIWLLRRRKRLKTCIRSFDHVDCRAAVRNMVAYSAALLCRAGVLNTPEEIYVGAERLPDRFGEAYAAPYERALAVYEKARFSNHPLTEEERAAVRVFVDSTVEGVRRARTRRQRWIDRHVRFWYR